MIYHIGFPGNDMVRHNYSTVQLFRWKYRICKIELKFIVLKVSTDINLNPP